MAQNFTDAPATAGEHSPLNTPTTPEPVGRGAIIAAGAFFLLLIVVGIAFLLPKLRHKETLQEDVRANAGPPPVAVTKVALGQATNVLDLPGSVQAFSQTPIYARTNGYITKRFVDIGDHVKAGQLLAIIEDPQTEQQLRQARATVLQLKAQAVQAQANAKLSTLNNVRNQQLQKEGVISQASADTFTAQAGANDATVNAALANIAAGEANVRSLEEQASFSRVTAPFTGVILSRGIDVGSLITSGSANSVTQLFTVGQSGTVRVFVNVPQANAPDVLSTATAKVTFRELPGQAFSGKVTRSASSIDIASRTMLTEIDLPNPKNLILPGMFATVSFNTRDAKPPVLIPANALFVRTAGPQTFVVDANNITHLRSLTLGRDYGSFTQVLTGLKPGDTVVLSPSDAVVDNIKVDPQLLK
ncbi:RND family efflux transporter, MFP subunit [Terriglobus roseus DSM 18391]|uniref:RND family efflux transporter, MFP subunit n=1 Tax=Terriglobus roseus (strain DSM 18391 / NRRL B-41598 / KBS 63) TaxID=926566 RepID=I3ZID7_TERRK|nr:efflux RND transporter periplasmic adaptor subunit [Terriglobus roseus]AFL89005.1 RND family efflux transporter, MFP subunit [Terriglobus roseus DSM 18391]